MAQNPLSDFLTTFKNGTSKALRVVSENFVTGGYSPANLTMQNAVTADGNGTNLDVNDYATAILEVRGTFSATINFEGSIDDTNWYPIVATKNDSTQSSTTTTVGLYEIKVATIKSVRARVSGYASGSITVIGKVSPLVNSEKSIQLTGSKVAEGIADFVLNAEGTLLASATRTSTTTSPNMTNKNAKGILVSLNVTVASGTGGLQVVIRGHDPVTGTVYWLNALPVAVVATGINVYEVCPAVNTAASGVKQRTSGELPRTWSVSVIHGDSSSYTYSVGYSLGV